MRDFIYGKSDVLVVILIIIIAGVVIFTRVNAIMDYPADQAAATTEKNPVTSDDKISDLDTSDDDMTVDDGDGTAGAADSEEPATFVVESGQSTGVIADNLLEAKIITDKQAFLNAVNAKEAATKLKAGTFQIPAGATPEEIVDILIS